MVIGSVYSRAHQIGHTGVHSNIIFISMFEMPYLGNKVSIGTCDNSATFQEDLEWIEPFCSDYGSIGFVDTFSHSFKGDGILIRQIGNSYAATKVHKFKSYI